MAGILGKKVGMTQLFAEDGRLVTVTVVQAGPCWVLQKKEKARDGYDGVQMGFEQVKERKVSKPRLGQAKKASVAPVKYLREIRGLSPAGYEVGQELKVDIFKAGDLVDVTGLTKGKGFQGVVKRHGFRGGADTHGSMFHRAPGSIGASSFPSRVFKGMKMGGHMGRDRKTIKNIRVIRVDKENHLLLLQGAVPGSADGLLVIVNALAGQKSA